MTIKIEGSSATDPWQGEWQAVKPTSRPLYVCVSGNTGAGKSTLVRDLAQSAQLKRGRTLGIDESSLHHPLLPWLFHAPAYFGYEIQLNFMLQRCLLAKNWLHVGVNVVMERSHIEDVVFARHLAAEGLMSAVEFKAYMSAWHCLDGRLSRPDLVVFINVPAQVSIDRLSADEQAGRRPREFPDEATKVRWVTSWHRLYSELLAQLQGEVAGSTRLLVLNEPTAQAALNAAVSALNDLPVSD